MSRDAYVKRLGRRHYAIINHREEIVGYARTGEMAYEMANDYINEGKSDTKEKPVRCIELDCIFDSVGRAAYEFGIRRNYILKSICKGCAGGGYHWEYVFED